jgi:hypothetical protein
MAATNQDPGGCGCGGVPCLPCSPCCIPEADLTATEDYPAYGVADAITLGYDPLTPKWSGVGAVGPGSPLPLNYNLTCTGGLILLTVQDDAFNPVSVTLTSYTCSPLHLVYTVSGFGTLAIDA